MNIIELINLTKKYGNFTAVDNVTLNIKKGEIFGLLGPNGAGKSTLILMMLGLTEPTYGIAKICGIESTRNPIELKKKVSYLPEDVGFYDDMTGLENLIYTARLNGHSELEAKSKAIELLEKVGLKDAINKKTGTYSRGMRQRLGLADVLIKEPEVVILDEPTLGLDPTGIVEFLGLIVNLSRNLNITVLFSSHHLHQVQEVCDRVGIFVGGKLLAEGKIKDLAEKLLGKHSIIIEAGIKKNDHVEPTIEELRKILSTLEILSIDKKNDYFLIECKEDLSSEIAKSIVNSNLALTHLDKKEYTLDEIYYRYFEKNN